jgi:hypothetical protein
VHQSGSDGIRANLFPSFSLSATSAGEPPFFLSHVRKVFDSHLVLDSRLLDDDIDRRQPVSDLANPLIFTERQYRMTGA